MSGTLKLWRNAQLATCDADSHIFARAAILTRGARIEWVGEQGELPAAAGAAEVHDLAGAWVTPGLIDCHTHLVFAGTRADEYAQRLRGRSYEEIARAGGGILSSVRAVREASEEQLFAESAPRLAALASEGVTTIEIKSGYGLTLADEAKMLRVARALGRAFPVTVRTTLLAAHTLPPEFRARADEYIDIIAHEWLPALLADGLVDAVDIFCERIAFSTQQAERLFCRSADPERAGEDARGAAVEPRRHAARNALPRTLLRSPGICRRGRGASARRRGHGRGAAAHRLLLPGRRLVSRPSTPCAQRRPPSRSPVTAIPAPPPAPHCCSR